MKRNNRIHPAVLPTIFAIIGMIWISGNKDRPIAFWGLAMGIILGIAVTSLINNW